MWSVSIDGDPSPPAPGAPHEKGIPPIKKSVLRVIGAGAAAVLATASLSAVSADAAPSAQAREHQRIVDFWTKDKVAKDTNTNTSVILTAGHCVYDNEGGAYATNWMFVPDYDATPGNLTSSGPFCADTLCGCWTAQALVAHRGFTSQTAFTSQATLYDFAFATVGAGGKSGTQLDATVGAQAISFSAGTANAKTDLFGYPSSAPYTGRVLTYSEGALGYDSRNGNNTYRVTSDMTQGCSGGPWFQGFGGGTGTMMSVNSYSYSGSKYMHGPKLNSNTQALHSTAQGATGNITVG